MLKRGVCSEPKDGRPHMTTHEFLGSPAAFSKALSGEIRPSRLTFRGRSGTNVENQQRTSGVVALQCREGTARQIYPTNDVSLSVSAISSDDDPTIKAKNSLEEEENEIIDNQSLDWLKSNVRSEVVDMLAMETKPVPTAIPGVSVSVMDTNSDLSQLSEENLTDFVFSSPLPDNVMVKQSVGSNYFEVLESGEQAVSVNNSSAPILTWSCGQSLQIQQSTALSQLSSPQGSYISYTDDALEEPVNTERISCSTSDLNSILFESISHDTKPDSSTVEIVEYSDALGLAVDRNFMCSDDTVGSLNPIHSTDVKSIPLTFTGVVADQEVSISNLQETSSDLTLNSLPNFLGLESSVPHSSTGNCLIEGQAGNIFEGVTPSVVSVSHSGTKTDDVEKHNVHDSTQLTNSNPNLSVTTISISNDEENATKILVDTHQGQQQMYVINTADLNLIQNQTGTAKISANQGSVYVINTADLTQGSSSVGTTDSYPENVSMTASSQSLGAQTTFTSSGISGFVLMPVVDSTANVIQAVPLQISDAESDSKRPPKKLLVCTEPGCGKSFKKASKLKVHQMLHTGERPFKCSLLGCEWAFTTSNKLKRHMESHEGRKDYLCDKPGCGHRFTTVYNLNTHRKLHDRPCTEQCPEDGCNQRFPTKRQLDLHLRNIHSCEDRTYKCPQPGCEKVFFSSGCMGSHMKVHQQNLEELKCKFPGCGKEFTKMCRLRQHERLHSGERPFICDYEGCTWAFATASKLKRHQTKHTGVRKWVCEVCNKQFHRSEHLKGHLITHSGDRPFVCPVEGCGNTFTAKSSLYVHLKKHDESGKTIIYHCPMEKCERHYANKASLRQHILVKHCNLPQKGSSSNSQGVANWLSLLGTGDASGDVPLSQENFPEGEALAQAALTPSRDTVLATDFLTGGMADQALLNSSSESIPDQSCNNLISHLVVPAGITLTSPTGAVPTASTGPLHGQLQQPQNLPQPQQQQPLFTDDQIDPRLLEAGEILQQQERMSFEAVERGKKSQIMLENVHGSARTDPRSNNIISQRAMKRWQKQKEIEAAKLRAQLDAQSRPVTTCNIAMTASGDYKSPVSNNVSLASQQLVHTVLMSRPSNLSGGATVKAEIPDMELQAEGISDTLLDGGSAADSFMTELFIRDPETGLTYRQTQLLQDDPPNPELMEDLESVTPSHSIVLDPSLDAHFVEDSLNLDQLE